MAESTLSVSRADILQAVGDYFGHGRNQYAWTREQAAQVNRVVKSGERVFYNPPNHSWRFLRPRLSISILAATSDYDLPDSFGGFLDQFLSFAVADNQFHQVRETSVQEVLRARQTEAGASIGMPEIFAVNRKSFDGDPGQRMEVLLFPTPQTAGTLEGTYFSSPDAMTDAAPYPLGGAQHGETLMYCCLAAAELERDKKLGPMKQVYDERLAASIAFDRRTGVKTFGINSDQGSFAPLERVRAWGVTYNGVPLS